MKSITLHNIDDSIELLIVEKAKRSKRSLNKTIQSLLKESLGIKKGNSEGNKKYFLDLFAVWSNDDFNEFNKNIVDLSEINERDWK